MTKEVKEEIKHLKNNKSPGTTEITVGMLKAGDQLHERLYETYQKSLGRSINFWQLVKSKPMPHI